jgi:pyruvate dehydrogenase E1 component alpha subunit
MDLAQGLSELARADQALQELGPRPFPLPVGDLAPVVVGAQAALSRGDWWVPSLRERVGATLRGVPVDRLVDGAGAKPFRVAPATGAPALRALMAVGLAVAEPDRTTLVHLGIGSASDGAFHEALNLAALLRPNVIFLVAVHPLDGDAPLGRQLASTPSALATAFGIPSETVDGTNAAAVRDAVARAKSAGGPRLVEARLQRAQENK